MKLPKNKKFTHFILSASSFLISLPLVAQNATDFDSVLDMSLQDLLSMEITSVSKKSQQLNQTASAIFVITREDIRRSGVTRIPDALRMVPGVHVAQIDANKWAVGSRGFNDQFANKLLVLIDGRSVYTPTHSGVYWDVQDTLLEDIERIEVIRGPGATVWGANAVNGVINIITRHAEDTLGGLISSTSGDNEKAIFGMRYGMALGDSVDGRIFVKYSKRDETWTPLVVGVTENDAGDHWESLRGGFRIDGQAGTGSNWTLQGDIYQVDANQVMNLLKNPAVPENSVFAPFYLQNNLPTGVESSGWNILGRWEHRLSDESQLMFKAYYDVTDRAETGLEQGHKTLDLEAQYQFQPMSRHDMIIGLGYRTYEDEFSETFQFSYYEQNSRRELLSAYIQDEIALVDESLYLTLGTKLERNDFTGLEIQPSIRMSWHVNDKSTLWGAVSRAIRSPSRIEDGGIITIGVIPLPPPLPATVLHLNGSSDLKSEVLLAWEAGFRIQFTDKVSSDIALFHNDYDKLVSYEPAGFEIFTGNGISAESNGLELSMNWQPFDWMILQGSYSYLNLNAQLKAGSNADDSTLKRVMGSTPEHLVSIRSKIDINERLSMDLWLSHVSSLPGTDDLRQDTSVDAYTRFNARLSWHPVDHMEFSLVGENLFDPNHTEFFPEFFLRRTEAERSVYAQFRLNF